MSEISIRVLGEDEWEQYKEFRLRALKESPEAFVADHATEAEYEEDFWRKRMRRSARLLAERGDEAVGILSLRGNEELFGQAAEIFGLWVPQELRGSLDPLGGWHSPRFGTMEPTTQLLLHGALEPGGCLTVDLTLLSG